MSIRRAHVPHPLRKEYDISDDNMKEELLGEMGKPDKIARLGVWQ
jgi:hypothetical protein